MGPVWAAETFIIKTELIVSHYSEAKHRVDRPMSKYLKNGMHLVCLDQCVISRFLDKPENEQWRDLCQTILKGSESRRILCPTSLEHLIETSSLPDADAVFLDEVMRKLSFGWALSSEPLLVTQQIISRLRSRRAWPLQRLIGLVRRPRPLQDLVRLPMERRRPDRPRRGGSPEYPRTT